MENLLNVYTSSKVLWLFIIMRYDARQQNFRRTIFDQRSGCLKENIKRKFDDVSRGRTVNHPQDCEVK